MHIQNAVAVYWDQRGAGKSYHKGIEQDDMTIEQFVRDTNALTDYLLKEFQREKIFIAGVSWGTIPAFHTIQKYPKKFYSYFGFAQIVDMEAGDLLAYDFMTKTIDNPKYLDRLKALGAPPYDNKAKSDLFGNMLMNHSEAYNKKVNGKTTADIWGMLSGILFSPDYTLADIWKTMIPSVKFNMDKSPLIDEIQKVNFSIVNSRVKFQFTLFMGNMICARH